MLKTDSKDLDIIKILLANARISLSKLSEKMNLSINGVKKRITKMEQEGVIKGYSCELSFGVLNEESGLVKIIVNTSHNIEDVIDFIGAHRLVFTIGVGTGNKLVVVFTYKSSSEVIEFDNWLKNNPALNNVEIFLLLSPPKKESTRLETVDYRIISELKNEGRMSLKELSKKTRISRRTLNKRLKNMLNRGIIYFSTILSPGSSEELIIFTTFCTLDENVNKIEFYQEVMKYFPNFWVGWIVVDKPVVIFSFFTPNIKDIRKVEEELRNKFFVSSIDTIIGGEGFHFDDWRTEHIQLMAIR